MSNHSKTCMHTYRILMKTVINTTTVIGFENLPESAGVVGGLESLW